MTPPEAFAAICLAAVGCDGQLGREEAQALRQQLEFRTPYQQLSEQAMGELFDQLLTRLREQGWSQLVAEAIPVLAPDQQETVLALACHLVRADRQVQPVEETFLAQLINGMQLSDERGEQISEAIAVLHRDALAGS
ncbi:MAG: tellurite resistance TerB family protein [Cyanobacteriota bacterium]|nr:tellurite resistance TerB family protein [Cyanobacteriota bacterium]